MEWLKKKYICKTLTRDWINLQKILGNQELKFTPLQLFHPKFFPIVIIRLSKSMYDKKIFFVANLLQYCNIVMFGLEVPASSEIGEGFVITHSVGTVLGAKSIGKNVTIYHQVTIGSASIKTSNTLPRPVIGDDVILYVGSKILGDIKIGKGVVVGANSVVLKSIPDYHIAYGVPAKYKLNNEKHH